MRSPQNLKTPHLFLKWFRNVTTKWEIFSNFCGLLRIFELCNTVFSRDISCTSVLCCKKKHEKIYCEIKRYIAQKIECDFNIFWPYCVACSYMPVTMRQDISFTETQNFLKTFWENSWNVISHLSQKSHMDNFAI